MKPSFILMLSVLLFPFTGSCQFPVISGDSIVLVEQSLKKISPNLNFTVIPGPAYGATEKTGLFVLPMLVYNLDKSDRVSPPSSTAMLLYMDFYGSWQVAAKQSFYWNHNKWRSFVTAGVSRMQLRFYGIGRDTVIISNDASNYDWINETTVNFSASVYRKIVSGFYGGLEYAYTYSHPDAKDSSGIARMTASGITSGTEVYESVFVPTFVWDNRDNIFWSTKGYFATLNLQMSAKILMSSTNYTIVTGSVSGYYKLMQHSNRLTLAWNFYTQLSWGSLPYSRFAAYGVSDHTTGYTKGKYVNNSEIAAQVEVRYDLWKFIALGGYAGNGKIFPSMGEISKSVWLPFGGLRTYVNIMPSRNLRLRFDLAVARQDFGFSIGLGQGL